MRTQRPVLATCLSGLLLLSLASCTSGTEELGERQRQQISQSEIEDHGVGVDLYTLVQRVRPTWLVKSGPHSMSGGDDIRVYVNGMRFEDPSVLRYYQGTDATSLRFLDAGRATVRYGIGHSHGAIIVEVRGGGYETP